MIGVTMPGKLLSTRDAPYKLQRRIYQQFSTSTEKADLAIESTVLQQNHTHPTPALAEDVQSSNTHSINQAGNPWPWFNEWDALTLATIWQRIRK